MVESEKSGRVQRGHALFVPYPSQGHINPMLQFAKRLAAHGVRATLATTRHLLRSAPAANLAVSVAVISDGFDDGGFAAAPSAAAYLDGMKAAGSDTLAALIESCRREGHPVDIVVYDSFLPWALDVAKRSGVAGAAFFTQSCAVSAVFYHAAAGRLADPATAAAGLPGLTPLAAADLPSYVTDPGSHPAYFAMLKGQFRNIGMADVALVNTFYELERNEVDWLESILPIKTIGPTIPSSYLDNQLPPDSNYGLHLYTPDPQTYMTWLDSKPHGSVVYISFGSMASIELEQMMEIAWGLKLSNKSFLLVVRASEASKLPEDFRRETTKQGRIVTWCSQLEVLAHGAIGCFVTHCGWNSTTEAIGLGVPMVGVPQWTDQLTNAKYVEDVWEVGVRAKVDEKGVVGREEIDRCIREVMDGGKSGDIQKNARKWREVTKATAKKGGSSYENTVDFISKYCSTCE